MKVHFFVFMSRFAAIHHAHTHFHYTAACGPLGRFVGCAHGFNLLSCDDLLLPPAAGWDDLRLPLVAGLDWFVSI